MSTRTENELHTLADLLLTGPVEYPISSTDPQQDQPAPQSIPLSAIRVELLMHARVPGYPSAWLTQYIQQRTQHDDPVLLVRCGEGKTECETFGADAEQTEPDSDLVTMLNESACVGTRIAFASPGATPDELASLASKIDRWTILTGADEQSVVSCYQLLKMLVTRGEGVGPAGGVGLVFVGCDEEASKSAADRIAHATKQYLGMHVEVGDVIPRIVPVADKRSILFDEPNPWPLVESVCVNGFRKQEFMDTAQPDPARTDARRVEERVQEKLSHSIKSVFQSESSVESERSKQPAGLSQYLPGACAMEARDPKRPEMELAVDPDGRMHILLRVLEGQSIEKSLLSVQAAHRWVRDNAYILALTERHRTFNSDCEPHAHLFTDRAAEVLAMTDAGFSADGPFRLHLLKEIIVAGETHLIHEPLM